MVVENLDVLCKEGRAAEDAGEDDGAGVRQAPTRRKSSADAPLAARAPPPLPPAEPSGATAAAAGGSGTDEEKTNWRMVVHAFKPEAGSVFELKVSKMDAVELVMVDYELPVGWTVVKHLSSDESGLVPEVCLAPWPKAKEEEEDSMEKQKEEAEKALGKALAENADMTKQLAERQQQLMELQKAQKEAEETRSKTQQLLAAVEKEKAELSEKVGELKATTATLRQQADVVDEMPTFKAIIETRVEEQKLKPTEVERVKKLKEEAKEHTVLAEEEAENQANELIEAEQVRESVVRQIQRLDDDRVKAIDQLTKAQTKYLEASPPLSSAAARRDMRPMSRKGSGFGWGSGLPVPPNSRLIDNLIEPFGSDN